MKKKITLVCLTILILFNFILIDSFAAETTAPSDAINGITGGPQTTTTTTTTPITTITDIAPTDIDSTGVLPELTDAKSTVAGENSTTTKKIDIKSIISSSSGSVNQTFSSVWAFLVGEWINNIPQLIVEATGSTIGDKFTVYELVMGKYEFFNLNFFDTDTYNNLDNKETLIEIITSRIIDFYYKLRNLCIAISIFVLIYIGIKMAISTVATDKVKYKKMFTSWVTSVLLVFIMHYIIVIFGYLTQYFLKLIEDISQIFGVTNIEEGILSGQITTLQNNSVGLHLFQTLLMCTIFIYYEIKFLIAYLKRYCEVTFLIVIAPLVTITYSIDKAKDNKAQAFSAWLKELTIKYFIQIVHAFTYCFFIAIAGAIAQTMPVFAAFFLMALSRAEKVMRKVFDVDDKNFEKAKVPILEKHMRFK